jgi:hypothetical protein
MSTPLVEPMGWFDPLLDEGDDPELWRVAVGYVLAEADESITTAEVGRCSHWLCPHSTRWKADGGFAWPTGYGQGGGYSRWGLPQFDWSIALERGDNSWKPMAKRSIRHGLRLTIPSRTRQHSQAALHVLWHVGREQKTTFYGFRKQDGVWACTASRGCAPKQLRRRPRRSRPCPSR